MSHSIAPWVTTYIKRLSRKKQRLHNKACSSNLESDWSAYRNFEKHTQHDCRRVCNQYLKHLLNPNSESGHKHLWIYIKSKRQDNIGIASLEANSTTYTDDLDKANILNNYFLLFLLKRILTTYPYWKTICTSQLIPYILPSVVLFIYCMA